MLALLFAERVILYHNRTDDKKFTYKDVPSVLKPQVKNILEESGLGFLVEE